MVQMQKNTNKTKNLTKQQFIQGLANDFDLNIEDLQKHKKLNEYLDQIIPADCPDFDHFQDYYSTDQLEAQSEIIEKLLNL